MTATIQTQDLRADEAFLVAFGGAFVGSGASAAHRPGKRQQRNFIRVMVLPNAQVYGKHSAKSPMAA